MALLPIATSSYDAFRTDALNRAAQNLGYEVDGFYGYQQLCWDLAAELWQNIGFSTGYPQTGANLYASECWTVSREINKGTEFTLIYNINELKRGDVIVIGASAISSTGHIAFCDENYKGTTNMNLLGQNQVDPSIEYGHIPTVTNLDISAFLGAFRCNRWQTTPVTIKRTPIKTRFPWVIYANKIRAKNML